MGASKILLPRDLRRRAFLLIREPCSASHSVNLACSDMCRRWLLKQRTYGNVMNRILPCGPLQ